MCEWTEGGGLRVCECAGEGGFRVYVCAGGGGLRVCEWGEKNGLRQRVRGTTLESMWVETRRCEWVCERF